MNRKEALKRIMEDEGMNLAELCEEYMCESVVPGVCMACGCVTSCEPDAEGNWCPECEGKTVVALTMLLL